MYTSPSNVNAPFFKFFLNVVESKRKIKTKTKTRIKQRKVQVQVQMHMVVCHNKGNQREVNTFTTTLVIQLFWIISEPVLKSHIIYCLLIYSNIGFLLFSVCLPSATKRVSAESFFISELISQTHWKQLKTCLAWCCDIDQIIPNLNASQSSAQVCH